MKKIVFIFGFLSLIPFLSWAVSNTLVIAQFATRGPVGAADEFLEIKNISTTDIDLGGYQIYYSSANGSAPGNVVVWSPGTILPAGKTYLCVNTGSSTYLSLADITYTSSAADSGQWAITVQGNSAAVIDAVAWGNIGTFSFGNTDTTAGFQGSTTGSRERLPIGVNTTDTDHNLTDFVIKAVPTPQGLGSGLPPTITNLMQTPFVPNASQSDVISTIVVAAGGHTISSASVLWSVNSVSQTPIGMTAVNSTYSATLGGQADGSIVQYNISVFDNATNNTVLSSGYIIGTTLISKIRLEDSNGLPIYNNLAARAKGVATVARGESFVNTANIMSVFMQDTSGTLGASGLDVFIRTSTINVNRGDNLVVEGTITNFNGLLELSVSTTPTQGVITTLSSGAAPSPILIPSISLINESYEGLLVKVADCFSTFTSPTTGSSSYNVYRNSNTGVIGTLRILSTANIPMGQYPPTYPVSITGVVSQNDSSSPFLSGYELTPRSTTDYSSTLVVTPEADLNVKLGQVIALTASGGTGTYTWSINSSGGATGVLTSPTGASDSLTLGQNIGSLYLTVQDSSGTVGSTGIIQASPTSAPLMKETGELLMLDKQGIVAPLK